MPIYDSIKQNMKRKSAGAGRGFVNPPTIAESRDPNYMSPTTRYELESERNDRKQQEATDKAYSDASKNMKTGGHVHHSEHYGKHAAGHELHMDHVKAMCGGGMYKK